MNPIAGIFALLLCVPASAEVTTVAGKVSGTSGASAFVSVCSGRSPCRQIDGAVFTSSGPAVFQSTATFSGTVIIRANDFSGSELFTVRQDGRIAVSTGSFTSTVTVNGIVESTSGGFRFPDGTLQATAGSTPGSDGWTDDGSIVRLTTIGDSVGIGTESTSKKLDVQGVAEIETVHASSASSGLPSYTFASDTDVGMYLCGTDRLCFSTFGTERWRIDESGNFQAGDGLLIRNGNGIESSPSYSFKNDTDSGILRAAADTIAVSLGGVVKSTFTSTSFDQNGLVDFGVRTAAQIRALACPSNCRVQNSDDFDIYTSTGTSAGQWRNSRLGVGP